MLLSFIAVLVFFNLFYLIARVKKDFSIIDTAWGLSFLLIFLVSAFDSKNVTNREILVGSLVCIWSLRLSGYIFFRSLKIKKEDYRYTEMREEWGEKANIIAYFKVFMLQAVLSYIIASPLFLLFHYQSEKDFGTPLDIVGTSLWIIGFLFEAIGDHQKSVFKRNAKPNEIMRTGLWKYTRHPNYFGEALLWWGIFFIVINEVPFYMAFWGPLILNFLLLRVSGVALLEQKYDGNKEFENYRKTTNAFIPWFPRSSNE